MVREDAAAVARVVEDAFAGRSELDDEGLQKDVRQVFYDLQDSDILEIRRDESRDDGETRRHYYWRVRDGHERADRRAGPIVTADERLYRRLGDDAWERHVPPEEDVLFR